MLDKLSLSGKLNGTYEKRPFTLEFDGLKVKVHFEDLESLKAAKNLFYDKLKAAKTDPTSQATLKMLDIEIYLEKELIAKIGKNAGSNFISNMLGLPFFEVVANSRMSDLMNLM